MELIDTLLGFFHSAFLRALNLPNLSVGLLKWGRRCKTEAKIDQDKEEDEEEGHTKSMAFDYSSDDDDEEANTGLSIEIVGSSFLTLF